MFFKRKVLENLFSVNKNKMTYRTIKWLNPKITELRKITEPKITQPQIADAWYHNVYFWQTKIRVAVWSIPPNKQPTQPRKKSLNLSSSLKLMWALQTTFFDRYCRVTKKEDSMESCTFLFHTPPKNALEESQF